MINIKKYRGQIGMSQNELADKVGVARTYLCTLEGPNYNKISDSLLNKISEVLGVSPIKILGNDNFRFAPSTVEEKTFVVDMILKSMTEEERNELKEKIASN